MWRKNGKKSPGNGTASGMSVVQSNIRSFNISDDIRIEVKKFRTDAGIDEVDIDDDEDDICKRPNAKCYN